MTPTSQLYPIIPCKLYVSDLAVWLVAVQTGCEAMLALSSKTWCCGEGGVFSVGS